MKQSPESEMARDGPCNHANGFDSTALQKISIPKAHVLPSALYMALTLRSTVVWKFAH